MRISTVDPETVYRVLDVMSSGGPAVLFIGNHEGMEEVVAADRQCFIQTRKFDDRGKPYWYPPLDRADEV